ncbi:MAG: pilin [Patescibacteria group bacterium]|nr:pilin [Patescibacteria group bacterium]
MKKYFFLIFLVIFLGGLAMPSVSRATQTECEKTEGTWLKFPLPVVFDRNLTGLGSLKDYTQNGRCIKNPVVLIFILYDLGLVLMAIAGVVMIMVGGYQYLTSLGGDQAKQAKTRIFYAIGGLALGLTSFVLLRFVNPDLINLTWDNEKLSESLREAVTKIEQDNSAGAAFCPTDSVPECSPALKKRVGDVCKKGAIPGYCAPQSNVGGICACDVDKTNCAEECNGNPKTICKNKACYTAINTNKQGTCLEEVGVVTCLDIQSLCTNDTECGFTRLKDVPDLNCKGMYPCKKDGKDGFCLGGKNLCSSLTEICSPTCSGDSNKGTEDLREKCHGKPINPADWSKPPTAVCFNGSSHLLISPSEPTRQCTDKDVAMERACQQAIGGQYGLCQKDGNNYKCNTVLLQTQ